MTRKKRLLRKTTKPLHGVHVQAVPEPPRPHALREGDTMTAGPSLQGVLGSLDPSMLMVGEAPSPTSDPTDPILSGRSGRWLRWLLGDHWTRFRERCSFANLVETYPGPRYPLDLARREALRLLSSAGRPRTLLLCGRKVATAFGYGREGFLSAVSLPGERLVFLPHPSGLCRWWNDEGNRSRARDALLSECYRKEAAS